MDNLSSKTIQFSLFGRGCPVSCCRMPKWKAMNKSIVFFFMLVMVSQLFVGCTERMNIELPSGSKKLVVEAYLFPGDSASWVRLTESANYFSNEPPRGVSHALVQLDDGEGSEWYFENTGMDSSKYFLSPEAFVPKVGKQYHLDIQLDSAVGGQSHFESDAKLPPLRIKIDSIAIQYAPDIEKWMVRLYALDSLGSDFYLFNSRVNGQWITDSIQRKVARADVYFDGRYLSGAIVQVLNKDELKIGDQYELIVSEISEAYYHYISGLQLETETRNPIFSGPPANVEGNISGGALGFFTAFSSTSTRVVLRGPQ